MRDRGDLTAERTLSFLDDLRASVLAEDVSKRDLISRLDALARLVAQEQEHRHDRLTQQRSDLIPGKSKRPNSLPRRVRNYTLARPHQLEFERLPIDEEPREDHAASEEDDETSGDPDDSFARLSILLEQSIMEGQHALRTSNSLMLGAGPDTDQARSSTMPRSVRSSLTRLLSTNDFDQPIGASSALLAPAEPAAPINQEHARGSSVELKDRSRRRHSRPPSYEQVQDDPSRNNQATSSMIDDGVLALESLIDQMTHTTFIKKEETGLTSSNFLIVMSVLVLIVSYLVSRHESTFGINCHCICPTQS